MASEKDYQGLYDRIAALRDTVTSQLASDLISNPKLADALTKQIDDMLQKFAQRGDLEFRAFQQVLKPTRNVVGERGHAAFAHAHYSLHVFLVGEVGGIVVDLHAVNSTVTKIEGCHKMMQALLEDVANNTLGRGVSPTVSAGLDAFDAFFNAARRHVIH